MHYFGDDLVAGLWGAFLGGCAWFIVGCCLGADISLVAILVGSLAGTHVARAAGSRAGVVSGLAASTAAVFGLVIAQWVRHQVTVWGVSPDDPIQNILFRHNHTFRWNLSGFNLLALGLAITSAYGLGSRMGQQSPHRPALASGTSPDPRETAVPRSDEHDDTHHPGSEHSAPPPPAASA